MGTTALFQRIGRLLELASENPLNLPEVKMRTVQEQVPVVLGLLDEARSVLTDVQTTFEDDDFVRQAEAAAAGQSDSLVGIGALISTEMAAQEVADLAFVAKGDLRRCAEEVRSALVAADPWQTGSAADKSLRHLRKGLISVESAMHEFEGSEAPVRVWFDLDVSLEVRRQYVLLRRTIQEAKPLAEKDPEAALGIFMESLAQLRSAPIYPLLRFADRKVIQRLAQRIQDPSAARSRRGRRHLWEDVVGFVELLSQVNLREELRDYDRKVVDRAYETLFGDRRKEKGLPADLLEELRRVAGRDDELARLVREPDRFPLAVWKRPLARLQEDLASRPAPVGPGSLPF